MVLVIQHEYAGSLAPSHSAFNPGPELFALHITADSTDDQISAEPAQELVSTDLVSPHVTEQTPSSEVLELADGTAATLSQIVTDSPVTDSSATEAVMDAAETSPSEAAPFQASSLASDVPPEASDTPTETPTPEITTAASSEEKVPDKDTGPDAQKASEQWELLVRARLSTAARYPELARQRNREGVVQVAFDIDVLGRISNACIITGSGNALLDDAALASVARCNPLPPPPQGPTHLTFSFRYYLN